MIYVHLAKITTSFPFPIDMLRFDRCWPIKSEGANMIAGSLQYGGLEGKLEVEVSTIRTGKEPPWTVARWASFQCTVEHLETHRM